MRVAAVGFEKLISDLVTRWLPYTTAPLELPLAIRLREDQILIDMPGDLAADISARREARDQTLIHALRRAHRMIEYQHGRPFIEVAPASRYNRDALALAFLAPDIQRDIVAGRQPKSLTLEVLLHMEIPLCWKRQREVLGRPQRD